MAGDVEVNPGPRFQYGFRTKYCKASDKLVECENFKKRFHALCSDLETIEAGNETWYYRNCKADCGLCSRMVLNCHKAVHVTSVNFGFIMNVLTIHSQNMKLWKTLAAHAFARNVKCSTSQPHILILGATWKIQTGLNLWWNGQIKKPNSPCRNKPISINGLKFSSININSIRGKIPQLVWGSVQK